MPDQVVDTPADALRLLKEGNERFLSGTMRPRDLTARVQETATRQAPFAAILGCMDSRVPPELVFDQGIGDVFSVRVAGNFADKEIIGCLEFAAHLAKARLIVVLGHTRCGAVQAACNGTRLGSLTRTLSHLDPALQTADPGNGPRDATNSDYVRAVTEAHVRITLEIIRAGSAILREAVDSGELAIIGALHQVGTGRVVFFDDPAAQRESGPTSEP